LVRHIVKDEFWNIAGFISCTKQKAFTGQKFLYKRNIGGVL
jgi:hypothetical protein